MYWQRISETLVKDGVMSKIKGNGDGQGGRNDSYRIGSRPKVSRRVAVREVEQGKHPGYHIFELNDQKYVRDNPDRSKKDNVNRKPR